MKKQVIIPSLCFAVLSTVAYEKAIHVSAAETSVNVSQNSVKLATKYVDVDSNSSLNLRSSASTKGKVIASLKKGTQVTVYSESNGWSKIKASGKDGYVSSKYLSTQNSTTVKASSTTTKKATKPATVPKTTIKYVNVEVNSTLNMRSTASTKGKVIASLKKGTQVTVYSESNGWSKIKASGKDGYVSSQYLSTQNSTTVKASSTTTKPATVPKTTTKYVNVEANSTLNMRSTASTKGKVIASLKKGTQVTVYSESNGWSKIKANGKDGYVSSQYLTTTKVDSVKPPSSTANKPSTPKTVLKYVNVTANSSLNMRETASTSGKIIAKLTLGMEVKVYSESNGWSKVNVNGKDGFVSSQYLITTKPAISVPPKETTKVKYVMVNSLSGLSMYTEPSTKSSVIVNIAKGVKVTVYSESNGWAKINVYGHDGYVKSENLSSSVPSSNNSDSNTSQSQSKLKYVNVDANSVLNMRSSASVNASIISTLTRGTAVQYYSESNGWARVTANGKTGYVSTQYLSSTAISLPGSSNSTKKVIYDNYNISIDNLVKIQEAAGAQTDSKYHTYIREDALKLNNPSKPTSGVVQGNGWNVRGGAGTSYWVVGKVNNGDTLSIISQQKDSDGYTWYEVSYNKTWVNANPDDIKYYLDPNNFVDDSIKSLQFLNLSKSTNLDAAEVNNKILAGKGILAGKASSFIAAGEIYGVNEIYLISHALLETGNGTSQLANGVQVNGRTVYNMYGIGAYDNSALSSGAQFAYNAGWFTPEEAIIGGAEFIANGYINSGQDTLYKMRWNPSAAASSGKATHQYATDIGWAEKQVIQIYNLYSLLNSYELTLQIPKYLSY